MKITFRPAKQDDTGLIYKFICELAEYEELSDEVTANEQALNASLFGEKRYAEVVFALADGTEVGFVLFFHNYSTFLGKPGIYIEDLYVKEDYRGKGIGRAILAYISELAIKRDCGRIEWWVLNWNPARKFYESIGAEAMSDWIVYRLSRKEINALSSVKVPD